VASASGVGGVPGTSSNIASGDGFGTEHAGVPELTGVRTPEAMSETSDERTTYDAARTRTQTVRTAPRLARLSVSLVLDDSLAERREQIVQLVKAAVGFDETRQDLIGVSTTAFAVPEEGADEPAEGEGAAPAAPSPVLELLLTRGVEIVSALAFVTVLLLSLRGARGSRGAARTTAASTGSTPGAGGSADPAGELVPALLARAQIDELVRSNPRRVGEILSRWASEETAGAR
jgi:flagellar M-ring protein FliF